MKAGAVYQELADDPGPPLLGCESCGLVTRNRLHGPEGRSGIEQRCSRCNEPLHVWKPFALQRTWACTLAAAVLYVPANLLPVMITQQNGQRETHTLLGGIHELWIGGSWFLAAIVFVASITVPVLKIFGLGLLAWTVRHAPDWRRLERARLFRLIDTVGHWSMLDVYVVVIVAATVRFGPLASVWPGPGLLSFAAVVVLTLFAAISFDPKMIWRAAADDRDARRPA